MKPLQEKLKEIRIEKGLGFFFFEQNGQICQTDIFLASLVAEGPMLEDRQKRWIGAEELDTINMPREGKRFIRDLHHQWEN